MQKKLIALAVAAITSGAAFAQTNVVISGNMDLSIAQQKLQAAGATTTTNTMGLHNMASTSNVALTVTEDLGNGLKAKVYIETDPAFGSTAGSAFANAPNWIELSGKFGAVSLGYINNFALAAATTAQPFGTATGGGYSGSFGRLDGLNTIGTPTAFVALGGAGVRDIRTDRTLQYVTPNFSGFSGGLQYVAKNTNAIGQLQLGLNYANGPIKVAYANSKISGDGTSLITNNTLTHNLLGANFTMASATIYAGYTSSRDTNNTRDSASWNLALKYGFTSALSGMINVLKVNDKLTTDKDRTLLGVGVDYSMSKRTIAYFRFENGDRDRAVSTAGNFSNMAIGMRHSF